MDPELEEPDKFQEIQLQTQIPALGGCCAKGMDYSISVQIEAMINHRLDHVSSVGATLKEIIFTPIELQPVNCVPQTGESL
jgi:hypothetical protein